MINMHHRHDVCMYICMFVCTHTHTHIYIYICACVLYLHTAVSQFVLARIVAICKWRFSLQNGAFASAVWLRSLEWIITEGFLGLGDWADDARHCDIARSVSDHAHCRR